MTTTCGADGSLWVGTAVGLARVDKGGRWQNYSKASTKGKRGLGKRGLPDDIVYTLAPGADGALWVGTGRGLARLDKNEHWQTYNSANTNGAYPTILSLHWRPARTAAPGSEPMVGVLRGSHWRSYSEVNTKGGLPMDNIFALTLGADDAIWVGTLGHGLARLDKNGRWQIYNNTNTNGGLPDDNVSVLTLGADGSLWVGTGGGLSNLRRPPTATHRNVEVIGEIKEVPQSTHNVSVVAFDSSYHTAPWMFHYVWRMTELGLLGDKPMPETRTKSPVYRATFDHATTSSK